MGAWGIGSALVPIAAAAWGIEGALVATGAIVPLVVLVRLGPLLRVDSAAVVPVVRVALLRSLELFRALPIPRSRASRTRPETSACLPTP